MCVCESVISECFHVLKVAMLLDILFMYLFVIIHICSFVILTPLIPMFLFLLH